MASSSEASTKAALALFLIALGGRFWWIHLAGSSLPLWDQWIGDFGLLKLAARHALEAKDLATHHNEHLLLGERLITLGLFHMSGRWEPRDGLVLSALLRALSLVLAFRLLAPPEEGLRRGLLILLALLGALPLGTFNLLSAFQVQFFLHESLGLLALAFLAGQPLSLRSLALGGLFLLLDFWNAASAITTIAAAAAVLGLQSLIVPPIARRRTALAFGYLVLFGAAVILNTPASPLFQARDPMEFASALIRLAAWPLDSFPPMALLSLAPPVLLVARLLRERTGAGRAWFVAAVGLAGVLQMLATALARARFVAQGVPQYEDGLWFGQVACFVTVVELLRGGDGALTTPRLRLASVWAAGLVASMGIEAARHGLSAIESQREVVAPREARFSNALRSGIWDTFEAESRGLSPTDVGFFSDPALRFRMPLGAIATLRRDGPALRSWLPSALTSDPPSLTTRAVDAGLSLAPALLASGLFILIGVLRDRVPA